MPKSEFCWINFRGVKFICCYHNPLFTNCLSESVCWQDHVQLLLIMPGVPRSVVAIYIRAAVVDLCPFDVHAKGCARPPPRVLFAFQIRSEAARILTHTSSGWWEAAVGVGPPIHVRNPRAAQWAHNGRSRRKQVSLISIFTFLSNFCDECYTQ
jgi:hypothetical protein